MLNVAVADREVKEMQPAMAEIASLLVSATPQQTCGLTERDC